MGILKTHRQGYQPCWATFLMFLVASTSPVCSAPYASSGNETDRLALLEFKAKITADPFGIMSSWNDSTHFCSWFGVSCGKRHPRVTKLILKSSQLGGSISPHIGNLTFLRSIDLGNNSLTNQIPPQMGFLRRLETLYLSENLLSGEVPPTLCRYAKLGGLDLESNSLSSEIPSNISKCTELQLLGLAYNKLVGKIPDELGLLSKLHYLSVNQNNLTGELPPSLGNLSSLGTLFASENQLVGRIPDTLGRLRQLTFLALEKNQLSGIVPHSIFNLSSITLLDISENHIRGYLPSDLFITLPQLEDLFVDTNQFTGSIPTSLSNASNLAIIFLQTNHFTGKVPSLQMSNALKDLAINANSLGARGPDDLNFLCSLTNATDLQGLHMGSNNFGGSIPECISNLSSKLTDFWLYENHISGSIPTGIANLVSLKNLVVFNNSLSGKVPSLQKLNALDEISINKNNLGTNGLDDLNFLCSLTNATDLQELDISINKFGGSLPECISNLSSKLTDLWLYENHIYGSIPTGIANLVRLKNLDASNNKLSGKVPSLQKLNVLQSLTVYDNSLGTRGPDDLNFLCSLTNATDLLELEISRNNFGGSLPACISNLSSKLTHFWLFENHISGSVPAGITNLGSLKILDADNNKLSGKVPSLQKLNALQSLIIYSNSLGTRGPDDLNFLCSLTNATDLLMLEISSNNFGGSLPACISNLSSKLTDFWLFENHISGSIPAGINNLVSLKHLVLFNNTLSGKVPSLQRLNALKYLAIFRNSLGTRGADDLNFLCSLTNATDLQELHLGNNNFGGSLPECISNLSSRLTDFRSYGNYIHGGISAFASLVSLKNLDIDDNYFFGSIPESLGNLSDLTTLSMANNYFQGNIPPCLAKCKKLIFLDLSLNNLSGSLPPEVTGLSFVYLSIAINNISGRISQSLCNGTKLDILDLADNLLDGSIPDCLVAMSPSPGVLDLKRNIMDGTVPDRFGKGCRLETLDISGNFLQGKIPISLANCKKMKVLNLGNNELKDTFPCELSTLSELQVLILKSNNFSGTIACPEEDSIWPLLQILDLASNHFSGELPAKFIPRLRSMMTDTKELQSKPDDLHYDSSSGGDYQNAIILTFKGSDFELPKVIKIFASIDLSNNAFHGEIPRDMGKLNGLIVLNLSHNSLSGNIPSSFGNLSQLESLDLSCNALSGNIPPELANLNFLESLNLSFNKLFGRIPTSTQLQSFNASSYEGNPELYGPPLTSKNIPISTPISPNESQWSSESEVEWMLKGAEVGFPVGLTIFIGPLLYIKRWRHWYCKHLGRLAMKILHREDQTRERRRWPQWQSH